MLAEKADAQGKSILLMRRSGRMQSKSNQEDFLISLF
jgi:hypothetical protein